MIVQHPAFVDPTEESTQLWRYIDFTKFASLMETKRLFFCRADKLQSFDRFEGTYPAIEIEYLRESPSKIDSHLLTRTGSTTSFVNCWHLSEKESVGMWKVYAPAGYGIAIRTTIADMKASFSDTPEIVYAGMVQYIDYASEGFYAREPRGYGGQNVFVPFIHKRSIFDFEKEYRLICAIHENPPDQGVFVSVNIDRLIGAVIVAPNSANWFIDLVNTLLTRNLDHRSAERSTFDLDPY